MSCVPSMVLWLGIHEVQGRLPALERFSAVSPQERNTEVENVPYTSPCSRLWNSAMSKQTSGPVLMKLRV